MTAFGITLGVAILFAVLVSNATTAAGVDRLVADFTGRADVLASPAGAFDATLSPAEVAALGRLPGVESVVPHFVVASAVRSPDAAEPEGLEVRGVEIDRARSISTLELTRGRFFRPGAREVVIPARLAARLRAGPGRRLRMHTPHGLSTVTVSGTLNDVGAARVNEGKVAFTSLSAARALAGAGAVFSRAEIVLASGVDVREWIEQHQGGTEGLQLRNASEIGREFKQFVSVLHISFGAVAGVALFIGAYLIYVTIATGVVERMRTYATLRVLGATRGQITRIVLGEALMLGLVATVAGLALGLLAAKGVIAMVANLFDIDLPGLSVRPVAVAAAVLLGVVATLLASLAPARRAGRVDPVVAMRGQYVDRPRKRSWLLALLLVAAGVAASFADGPLAQTSTFLLLFGAVRLVPAVLRPLARVLGAATRRLSPGAGDVAVLHLVKERSRSANTLGLVMVVMAMLFTNGAISASMSRAVERLIDRQYGADLHVDAAAGGLRTTFEPSFERRLRSHPGVARVTAVRVAQTQVLGAGRSRTAVRRAFAIVVDPDSYFDLASFPWVHGDDERAASALRRGGTVLVPQGLATQRGLAVGSELRLRTLQGTRDFRVAGIVSSVPGPPTVVIGVRDGVRYFGAARPHRFSLAVAPGVSVRSVQRSLERSLSGSYALDVDTTADIKDQAAGQMRQFFNIFLALVLVSAVVGLLALANTLAISVLQRSREVGVLRAIGTTRAQVRRMVLAESATIGLAAFVLSMPLGWLMARLTVRSMSEGMGLPMQAVYPATWVPGVAASGIVLAALAALAPARRAARLEVVEALQFE